MNSQGSGDHWEERDEPTNSTDSMEGTARKVTEDDNIEPPSEKYPMEQMIEEAKDDLFAQLIKADEVLDALRQRAKQLYNKTQEANRMGASSSTIDALLTRRDEVGRLLNFIRNLE